MINFFSKRLNKKGFTLAELLIVVAIIAILVAIAVPIFTSQLNKAKIARDQANIRAVKAAAIAAILDDKNGVDLTNTTGWNATATLDKNYDITNVAVATGTVTSPSEAGKITYSDSGTTIIVNITASDINYSASTGGGEGQG